MFKGCFKKCLSLETCDCCRRGCEQTAKCAFILGVGGVKGHVDFLEKHLDVFVDV